MHFFHSVRLSKNALFPFRSAFTLAHYVRFHLTSVLRKIRLLDFTSGSLLLALLLKPNGFSRSAVRSPWRVSQTNVCSMLRKIRLLDFTSGSSRVTSFQKCKNALFPFRSAFAKMHFFHSVRLSHWRTTFGFTSHPCYVKSAIQR